jgi:Fe2+ or Zn2+ uptake regulation protein
MTTKYETPDALRARGLRPTRPRRLILDVVRATDAHRTAAFVYQRVRRRLPRVSLATVYRNLRRLAIEGFLAERSVRRRVAVRTGFEVLVHRTEFFGRCVACRRRRDRSVVIRQKEK